MEDSVAFSTDSDDSILTSSKLDAKELSFTSPTTIVSKLNALSNLRHNVSGGHDKLAELFRKDLISAMKLPDTESLLPEEYHLISDPWRQDWERGVQVPISPDEIKESNIVIIKENENLNGPYAFKLPKKFLHSLQDTEYKQSVHELHGVQALADEVCRYDLDYLDTLWLKLFNEIRSQSGEEPVDEWTMERVMELLETNCYDGMQEAIKTVEGLGIEYDEDVVCDVCRSPEVEEGNEMVFCDGCDICVHQACYGILKVPKGNWMCKTCVLNVKPSCALCPNIGGAMKITEDGLHWAHLSCAIWIPEVTIGCSETMQPIKSIDEIPATRWALVCTLCRERTGACIQCCVKKCKTAFHVTCAFEHNLEMKVNLEDDNSDIQLKGYCPLHSKRHDSDGSPRKTPTSTPKKANEMTEEEKTVERSRRLQKLTEDFYTYAKVLKVSDRLNVGAKAVDFIYSYWILKRRCNFNKALLTPKVEEGDLLLKQREDTMVARLKMFIHLRQDLERVRNLCYMVTKREKLRSQHRRIKMLLFLEQAKILRKEKLRPNGREYKCVCNAHKQNTSIYDESDKVVKTSKYFESVVNLNETDDDIKTVSSSRKMTPVKAKPKPRTSTENPYAKPTYKSFSWMLSSRRRSQSSNATSPEKLAAERNSSQQKRRGRLPKIGLENNTGGNDDTSVGSTSAELAISYPQPSECRKSSGTKPELVSLDIDGCNLRNHNADMSFGCKAETADDKLLLQESVSKQTSVAPKRRRGRPPKVARQLDSSLLTGELTAENQNSLTNSVFSKESHSDDKNVVLRDSDEVQADGLHQGLSRNSNTDDPMRIDSEHLNTVSNTDPKDVSVVEMCLSDHTEDPKTRPENSFHETTNTTCELLRSPSIPESLENGGDSKNFLEDCRATSPVPHDENVLSEVETENADNEIDAATVVPVTAKEKECIKPVYHTTDYFKPRHHVLPKNGQINGRRRRRASSSKKSTFGRTDSETEEDSDTSKLQSRTTQCSKENGIVKNQPTLDSFVQRLKCETEKNDVTVKENGSLNNKQQNSDQVCFNGRSENAEAMAEDSKQESIPVCTLDSPVATEGVVPDPSQRLCGTLSPDLSHSPSRKRSRVNSDLNLHPKKRLRFAIHGRRSLLPNGSEGSSPDDSGSNCGDLTSDTRLNDTSSKVINGFSPVQHRYPTRQSLGTS